MEEDQESMLKKLTQMKKEYARKQKKLEKSIRKSKAKAHVKQILQEQEIVHKTEKECEHFKDIKRVSGELHTNDDQCGHSSKTKGDSKTDLNLPKSHLLKTPVLSENLDLGDFVIEKTSQSKEDGGLTVGPCGDSEQSASSRNLPSSSESSGKRTLSLKARRRKTLSPNTFSNKRKSSPIETNPTKAVVNSILIPDDEEQKIKDDNSYDIGDKSVAPMVHENSSEIYLKSSNESRVIEKPKPFESESSTELLTSSREGCEKIKTKRRRGRKPRRYQRQSLPGPAIPVVNSSESQGSQELETLMLVQESLGLCSRRGRRKTRHSDSHQPILLSSVFQFIIDDAKRAQGEKDFVLPTHTFHNLMETKCLHKISSEGVYVDNNVENEKNLEKEISVEKKTMHVVEQMPSSVVSHSTQTFHDGKEKEKWKEEVNLIAKNGLSVEQDVEKSNSVLPALVIKANSSPSGALNLKKGNNSGLDSISGSVSKDSYKEIFASKDTQMDVDFNGEVNVKSNSDGIEDTTHGSEIFDQPVCPDDGQLESELNNSLGSDQQTESDDENFGDILKERMATQVLQIWQVVSGIFAYQLQFPADDPVIQSHIAVVLLNKKRTEVVVCLCKKSVSLWALHSDQFSCLQKWSFPEELTALCGDLMLPKSSEVRFTAILRNSTLIQLYSAVFQENQAFPLFKITDFSAPCQHHNVLLPITGCMYVLWNLMNL
ncbi:uncharacterized protein LOC125669537 isoform X4 [Ostrea edulis]|uniref:uncharacterized protein LOC125669537 isoform X4 n=1 Tax=Ostrea edulis TaxID=37623 RepID=UPI0024AED159|nr:uncharacterized protein LOC125669537 isoform X4 [Ostrea edulis]